MDIIINNFLKKLIKIITSIFIIKIDIGLKII